MIAPSLPLTHLANVCAMWYMFSDYLFVSDGRPDYGPDPAFCGDNQTEVQATHAWPPTLPTCSHVPSGHLQGG